jgi:hypothetical protein
MMAALVYLACAATAFICAVLLWRGYRRSRAALLFWSALCFAAFTLDNIVLCIDRLMFPTMDLSAWRLVWAPIGVGLLLYGLIWKSR